MAVYNSINEMTKYNSYQYCNLLQYSPLHTNISSPREASLTDTEKKLLELNYQQDMQNLKYDNILTKLDWASRYLSLQNDDHLLRSKALFYDTLWRLSTHNYTVKYWLKNYPLYVVEIVRVADRHIKLVIKNTFINIKSSEYMLALSAIGTIANILFVESGPRFMMKISNIHRFYDLLIWSIPHLEHPDATTLKREILRCICHMMSSSKGVFYARHNGKLFHILLQCLKTCNTDEIIHQSLLIISNLLRNIKKSSCACHVISFLPVQELDELITSTNKNISHVAKCILKKIRKIYSLYNKKPVEVNILKTTSKKQYEEIEIIPKNSNQLKETSTIKCIYDRNGNETVDNTSSKFIPVEEVNLNSRNKEISKINKSTTTISITKSKSFVTVVYDNIESKSSLNDDNILNIIETMEDMVSTSEVGISISSELSKEDPITIDESTQTIKEITSDDFSEKIESNILKIDKQTSTCNFIKPFTIKSIATSTTLNRNIAIGMNSKSKIIKEQHISKNILEPLEKSNYKSPIKAISIGILTDENLFIIGNSISSSEENKERLHATVQTDQIVMSNITTTTNHPIIPTDIFTNKVSSIRNKICGIRRLTKKPEIEELVNILFDGVKENLISVYNDCYGKNNFNLEENKTGIKRTGKTIKRNILKRKNISYLQSLKRLKAKLSILYVNLGYGLQQSSLLIRQETLIPKIKNSLIIRRCYFKRKGNLPITKPNSIHNSKPKNFIAVKRVGSYKEISKKNTDIVDIAINAGKKSFELSSHMVSDKICKTNNIFENNYNYLIPSLLSDSFFNFNDNKHKHKMSHTSCNSSLHDLEDLPFDSSSRMNVTEEISNSDWTTVGNAEMSLIRSRSLSTINFGNSSSSAYGVNFTQRRFINTNFSVITEKDLNNFMCFGVKNKTTYKHVGESDAKLFTSSKKPGFYLLCESSSTSISQTSDVKESLRKCHSEENKQLEIIQCIPQHRKL